MKVVGLRYSRIALPTSSCLPSKVPLLSAQRSELFIISLLGALSVVSPFAIDMYLPAFPELAKTFGVPSTTIALTLSSYFIGLALARIIHEVPMKRPPAA